MRRCSKKVFFGGFIAFLGPLGLFDLALAATGECQRIKQLYEIWGEGQHGNQNLEDQLKKRMDLAYSHFFKRKDDQVSSSPTDELKEFDNFLCYMRTHHPIKDNVKTAFDKAFGDKLNFFQRNPNDVYILKSMAIFSPSVKDYQSMQNKLLEELRTLFQECVETPSTNSPQSSHGEGPALSPCFPQSLVIPLEEFQKSIQDIINNPDTSPYSKTSPPSVAILNCSLSKKEEKWALDITFKDDSDLNGLSLTTEKLASPCGNSTHNPLSSSSPPLTFEGSDGLLKAVTLFAPSKCLGHPLITQKDASEPSPPSNLCAPPQGNIDITQCEGYSDYEKEAPTPPQDSQVVQVTIAEKGGGDGEEKDKDEEVTLTAKVTPEGTEGTFSWSCQVGQDEMDCAPGEGEKQAELTLKRKKNKDIIVTVKFTPKDWNREEGGNPPSDVHTVGPLGEAALAEGDLQESLEDCLKYLPLEVCSSYFNGGQGGGGLPPPDPVFFYRGHN